MATIFPLNPSINDEFSGYRWNGTVWEVIGIDLNQDYASQLDLTAHESDTTSVHGISNTSNLVYTNDSRLTDSRTPNSHASSHGSTGSDALTLSQSQITNLTIDLAAKAPISSPTFTGTVTVPSPTNATDAATKSYVDSVAEGLHIHASAQTATTTNIDLSNPPSTIDGVILTNNMRVLVKNQSTQSQNGIYVYNSSTSTLIRALDFDTAQETNGGDFIFVTGGNTYDNTGWVQTETVTSIGSDPIIFQQFSGAGTYSAGTGLALNGTVFSNTGVLSLIGTTDEVDVSSSTGSITLSLPATINANTSGNSATSTKLATARTIAVSGDVTGSASFDGSANATISATLSNSGVSAGTYNNNAAQVRPFTVDAKGRITSIGTAVNIAIAQSAVTNLTTDLASKAPINSPSFTGTPTAPTAAQDTSTTQIATTQFVVDQGYLKTSIASSTYAPKSSPSFTGTATFTNSPVVSSSIVITVDGTVITEIRDTYSFDAGGNALQIRYAFDQTINPSYLAAAQALTNGSQLQVFDGTSTYTFTATGAGFQGSFNDIVIPGSGTSSGYYYTGSSVTISGTTRTIVDADSQTGNAGKYLYTDGTSASWQNPFDSAIFNGLISIERVSADNEGGEIQLYRSSDNTVGWTMDVYGNTSTPSLRFFDSTNTVRLSIDGSGTTTVTSPTSAGSTGVRNVTISTSNPSGGNDGDMWVVYTP